MTLASIVVGIGLFLFLVAFPVVFYLRVVKPATAKHHPRKGEAAKRRARLQKLSAIMGADHVVSFDCEESRYDDVAAKLLALAAPAAVHFTCSQRDEGGLVLRAQAVGEEFDALVEERSIELSALLRVLNKALKVAGAAGQLITIDLGHHFVEYVTFANAEQRRRLLGAQVLQRFSARH